MLTAHPQRRHFLWLAGILGLGAILRLLGLAVKPLWMDEVITALFSFGRSVNDVPLDVLVPVSDLEALFRVRPNVPLADIVNNVNTDSMHPPLFFMLMYSWMSWIQPDEHWVWVLRLPPALFGVGAIAAVYWLARVAFSPKAGLVAASLMAVSPFAVYLSQEARHYTLPMLWITLALAALVQMQADFYHGKGIRVGVWLGWIGLNLLALYTHYFSVLALAAQLGAIALWLAWQDWQQRRIQRWRWGAIALGTFGIGLGYLPWITIMVQHLNRPEANWLAREPDWYERFLYLVQMLVNGVLMVVAFPVEQQSRIVIALSGALMLATAGWLLWQIGRGVQNLWPRRQQYPGIVLLLGFVLCILLEFLVIVYGLNRDITVAPRYNFVVYPALCALVAIALTALPEHPRRGFTHQAIAGIVVAGLVSSLFVNAHFVFQKPYHPDQVAQNMVGSADTPVLMVSSYQSLQNIALGLSFALELPKQYQQALGKSVNAMDVPLEVGFMFRPFGGYSPVWNGLVTAETQLKPPFDLWAIATPGMKSTDYPRTLRLQTAAQIPGRIRCQRQPDGYRESGVPYQQFTCR